MTKQVINMPNISEKELKTLANDITDVFGGADGGLKFVQFYHNLLPFLAQNQEKESVQHAITVIKKFHLLVTAEEKQPWPKQTS